MTDTTDKKANDPKFVQITTSVQGGQILLYPLDKSDDIWRSIRLASG